MTLSSALIETHQLAGLAGDDLRILETDQTRQHFDAGHIAGSVFWPITELFTPEFKLKLDPTHFADLLSRCGITSETTVVCSFSNYPSSATWLYWLLTGFGHEKTFVLNGGTPNGAWKVGH